MKLKKKISTFKHLIQKFQFSNNQSGGKNLMEQNFKTYSLQSNHDKVHLQVYQN